MQKIEWFNNEGNLLEPDAFLSYQDMSLLFYQLHSLFGPGAVDRDWRGTLFGAPTTDYARYIPTTEEFLKTDLKWYCYFQYHDLLFRDKNDLVLFKLLL